MILHKLSGRKQGGYTTFGCVWEKGEVRENSFCLLNESGEEVPVQSLVTAYWPDKSIKWSTHTADSDKMSERICLTATVKKSAESEKEQLDENGPVLPEICTTGSELRQDKIWIDKREEYFEVNTGMLSLKIPIPESVPTKNLAMEVKRQGTYLAERIYPVFQLERRKCEESATHGVENDNDSITYTWCNKVREFRGEITEVTLEQSGPLQAVFCFKGDHIYDATMDCKMPFVIRMYLWNGSTEIRFVHTFIYDGVEERDYLKGMGIRLDACLTGKAYNRYIQFATDGPQFTEAAMLLFSSHPRVNVELYRKQIDGEIGAFDKDRDVEQAIKELPVWNRYSLCQDSSYHFAIRKQTGKQCCVVPCRQGKRAPGVMAVTGENGGLMLGIRDFWQKCPSGLEVSGLSQERSTCTAWFYSPEAEAYDFRHYDTRSYPRTCYEGFDNVGASAVGIAVTSECQVAFTEKVPTEEMLYVYGNRIQKPCVYVGNPEYYHQKRAFGLWSLPKTNTETEKWLEEQLEKAFLFYQQEVENRDWYGLFDYGDVMHTYDVVRHVWRYDIGGFAWQNTELVPTYWLWLYFLRTGREDVFSLAEAMTRHCSEVDIYHLGEYQGLGSRHNVRHWGCSCKEPRISMAGHQRFLYYLTGDLRLGDIMDEVKDADYTMARNEHTQATLPDGTKVPGIRSGPDWSSFVSNWMTAYERTLENRYLERILNGIRDIANTPYGFASGPDYYYDVESAHLIYRGEIENTPNQHLQICMGGVQVWFETAIMLDDDTLNCLLSDLGAFYLLNKEEKSRLTNGQIHKRPFSWPMFATGITAYSAMRNKDEKLANRTWEILLGEVTGNGRNGYEPICYAEKEVYKENDSRGAANSTKYKEIPWVTTNCTAQWCLNLIMCLEFIREYLPEQLPTTNSEII